MNSIELFAGAGGLAMGVSNAGFKHKAIIELNADAINNLSENKKRKIDPICGWPLIQGDVRKVNFSEFTNVDLVAGGPPCQPFSIGGKHKGNLDSRDLFPEAVRAVRELRPKAFLFENVKGLLRQSFAKYFEYISLQLTYPEIVRKKQEDWETHLERLEKFHTKGTQKGLHYNVVYRLLNSADYGIPQKRERVIIVGFRSDLKTEWAFPQATHSKEALNYSKFVSQEYWDRHRISKKDRPEKKVVGSGFPQEPHKQPWVTIRDAFSDLPDPKDEKRSGKVLNHQFMSGARTYQGHTGSPLDEPAKTLKAGDHGVPGGENMLLFPNGDVRYFTIRESARLQTFPDNYFFCGSWTESMRQIGNAVPVKLSQIIAENIKRKIENE